MSRQRLFAALGALALAIVGTVGMVAYVSGAEERAAAGEDRVEVWVAERRVPPGTPGESIGSFTTLESVPRKLVTNDTVGDLADLTGLVAEVEILQGEILSIGRFTTPQVFDRESNRVVELPNGMQEITIALDPERAAGGLIAPGDTVGVLISFDPFTVESDVPILVDDGVIPPGGSTNTTTHQALHKILVTNVQLEEVPEVEERSGIGDEEDTEIRLVPSGKLLVTMAVDVFSAERIVFGQEFGTIWLSSEPDSTIETPSVIQNRGTIYLDEDELDGAVELEEAVASS